MFSFISPLEHAIKEVSLNTCICLPAILVKRVFCGSCNKSYDRLCFERAKLLLGTVCLKYVTLSATVSLITVGSLSGNWLNLQILHVRISSSTKTTLNSGGDSVAFSNSFNDAIKI